jgi:methylmalonyl-CoA/ethylmalonyl-CoA epimerase
MIGRLNHVAIAVPDLRAAAETYRTALGARVSEAVPQPDHGVTTVFVELPNTKIELLEPLGDQSPIAKFLERSPLGGIHHLCYEVDDIVAARDRLLAGGALFLHPKDFCGTLVELEEA